MEIIYVLSGAFAFAAFATIKWSRGGAGVAVLFSFIALVLFVITPSGAHLLDLVANAAHNKVAEGK